MHHNSAKTHCAQGHEFTAANIRMRGTWRVCVTCRREKNKIASGERGERRALVSRVPQAPWPLRSRLEPKIRRGNEGDCWVWTGRISKGGYGALDMTCEDGRRRDRPAHRLVYEELVGPIAPGLVIDHTCANKLCVNPAHLEPVTASENSRRGTHGRKTERTHCARGHEFSESNTKREVREGGRIGRSCKACARESRRTFKRVARERAKATRAGGSPRSTPAPSVACRHQRVFC